MTNYALDSDTVTYILKGKVNVCTQQKKVLAQGDNICIPPYVYYEVQRWISLKKATAQQKVFDMLYEETGISPIDHAMFDLAVSIYTDLIPKGIVIDDGDIFITAFCIKNNYVLVTSNTDHYKHISGLKFTNWNA